MKYLLPIRLATTLAAPLLVNFLVSDAGAQAKPSPAVSSLPDSQPTQPAGELNAPSVANRSVANKPAAPVPHADVQFLNGQLTVDATNESLNQILREISSKARIKVTGGVADERVFGTYGPAAPAMVLAELLEGTGSNLLLVDDAEGSTELILTPRRGGASPPNPNAAAQNSAPPDEERGEGQYVPPIRPYAPPVATGRGPVGANPDGSPANQPNAESSEQNPNANKTPQQIYDQLQRALQQRQQYSPQPQ